MKMDQSLLEAYNKELGSNNSMSLEDLINSHRYLRTENKKYWEDYRKDRDKILSKAKEDFMQNYEDEFFIEKLKSLTLKEIIEILKREN